MQTNKLLVAAVRQAGGRSELASIERANWNAKKSAEAPEPTIVPDTLHDIDFMVKDSKRFSDTGGWGWAQFDYDSASDTFTLLGTLGPISESILTFFRANEVPVRS